MYSTRKGGWQDSGPIREVTEWQVACHRGWALHLEPAQAYPRVLTLEIQMFLRGWGKFTSKQTESSAWNLWPLYCGCQALTGRTRSCSSQYVLLMFRVKEGLLKV